MPIREGGDEVVDIVDVSAKAAINAVMWLASLMRMPYGPPY